MALKDYSEKKKDMPESAGFHKTKDIYDQHMSPKLFKGIIGSLLVGLFATGIGFVYSNLRSENAVNRNTAISRQDKSENERLSGLEEKLRESLALTLHSKRGELHISDGYILNSFLKKYVDWGSGQFKRNIDEYELRQIRDVWQQYKSNYDNLLESYVSDTNVQEIMERNPDLARMYPMPKRLFEPVEERNIKRLGRKRTIDTNQARSIRVDKGPSITPSDLEENMSLWKYSNTIQYGENKDIAMWMWFAGLIRGVDPNFIFSVATLENNYGYSELYLKKKNMFGIHYPGGEWLLTQVKNPLNAFVEFGTRRGCVSYFADLICDNYIKNGQDNVFDIANGIDGSNDYVGSGKVPWINGVMCNMRWGARKNPELYSDIAPKIREIEMDNRGNVESTSMAQNNPDSRI